MQSQRNNQLIYTLLLAVWALVMAWQVEEHVRVSNAARAALENRAGDIANTIGIVLRSQRRFGVFVEPGSFARLLDQPGQAGLPGT